MSNKTLRDLVGWTQQFHREIAESIEFAATQTNNEREQMLFGYLAGHENELIQMIDRYGENASDKALNTWVSAYLEQYPAVEQPPRHPSFNGMDTADIMNTVQEQHGRIVNIYEHLEDFVQSSAHELVSDIRHLEEQTLLRISQAANRLEDI